MRIAIVHDWLDTWRGGESTLAEVLTVFPDADLYALVDFLPEESRALLLGKRAHASFLQRIPGARRHFRALLPLFPRAIESLDVSAYDVVVSVSHAVAKGVRTNPGQLHACYCLTPMRYAWDMRESYLASVGAQHGIRRALADGILDRLRRWDVDSSRRVSSFIAISDYIRQRILRCYHRQAAVIHPPVDVDYFTPPSATTPAEAFVTASHWVAYKRIDLIVKAFRSMPSHRLIVAGSGPDAERARESGASNVQFVGEVSKERLRDLLRTARAFVFAGEEDFGIAPLEAQACGTPVIAYARGGVAETVRGLDSAQPTGVFFSEQTEAAIREAVTQFEHHSWRIGSEACRANARRFGRDVFRSRFAEHMAGLIDEFKTGRTARVAPC
jgi:glycosyltransferase involved in cell wall biosynthesis